MSQISNWLLVDVFTVDQAAALWCNVDPKIVSPLDLSTPSEVMAIRQLLTGSIVSGDLIADSSKNVLARGGDYSSSLVTRRDLEKFAKLRKQFPAFLFDTLAPFVDPQGRLERNPTIPVSTSPQKLKTNKGERSADVDWDSFTMEIVRIANTPDGLPDTRAELVRIMLLWLLAKYDSKPAESIVKQRISRIYRYLDIDKTKKNRFLPLFG